MYRNYYQLDDRPFELNPTGQKIYLSESHQEAIALLRYGILSDKGFVLLTGGVGTGKTTIINGVFADIPASVRVCLINNPSLTRDEFFQYLSTKFGFSDCRNKIDFLASFEQLLRETEAEGGRILLVVDEAQVLSIELFEEIRLLSNLKQECNCLGVFFIGQPELQEKLSDPQLLPLRQRIGLRYHLEPLSAEEVWQYIVFRIHNAGGIQQIFDKSAVEYICKISKGNPRLINIICDQSLITGYTRELLTLDEEVIQEAIQDISFPGEEGLKVSPDKQQDNGNRFAPWIILSGAVILSGTFFYTLYRAGGFSHLVTLLKNYLQ